MRLKLIFGFAFIILLIGSVVAQTSEEATNVDKMVKALYKRAGDIQASKDANDFQVRLEARVNSLHTRKFQTKFDYGKYPELKEADKALKTAVKGTAAKYGLNLAAKYPYIYTSFSPVVAGSGYVVSVQSIGSWSLRLGGLVIILAIAFVGYLVMFRTKHLSTYWKRVTGTITEETAYLERLGVFIQEKNDIIQRNVVNLDADWFKDMDIANIPTSKLKTWISDLRFVEDENKKILSYLRRVENLAKKQSSDTGRLLHELDAVKTRFESERVKVGERISQGANLPDIEYEVRAKLDEYDGIISSMLANVRKPATNAAVPAVAAAQLPTIKTDETMRDVFEFLRHFHLLLKAEEIAVKTEIEAINAIMSNAGRPGIANLVSIIQNAGQKKINYYTAEKEYERHFQELSKTILPQLRAWFELEGKKIDDVELTVKGLIKTPQGRAELPWKFAFAPLKIRTVLPKPVKKVGKGPQTYKLEVGDEGSIKSLEELWARLQKIPQPPDQPISEPGFWYLLGKNINPRGDYNDLAFWVLNEYKNKELADELNIKRDASGLSLALTEKGEIKQIDPKTPANAIMIPNPATFPALDEVRKRFMALIDSSYGGVFSKSLHK